MTDLRRKSQTAFVVIKLCISATPYYLMRFNRKWGDVNFIGGHLKDRDAGNYETAARRELWEEVPSIRSYTPLVLDPITKLVRYGPIYSRSKGGNVEYDIQFFLLRLQHSPHILIDELSDRTMNVWVPQNDLLKQNRFRLSGLVRFLDEIFPGGLSRVPYSFDEEVIITKDLQEDLRSRQLAFSLS